MSVARDLFPETRSIPWCSKVISTFVVQNIWFRSDSRMRVLIFSFEEEDEKG
jgi:hypothetical protein